MEKKNEEGQRKRKSKALNEFTTLEDLLFKNKSAIKNSKRKKYHKFK